MNKATKENKVRKFNTRMQANLLLVFCIVIIMLSILIARIIYINMKDGDKYERRVLSQQTYMSNAIPFKRGEIVDRNMTKLAYSEKVYNMVLDPKTILGEEEYKEPTVNALIKCFDIKKATIESILKEKSAAQYVVMKEYKGLDYEHVTAFQELQKKDKNIKGVWFEEEYIRKYPNNSLACQVVGFTSTGNLGISGIEESYNEQLNGVNGREYGYFNSELKLERTVKPAVNGNTIVSTVDANVQQIVEKKIAEFEKEMGGEDVSILVMNPNNGEIYAMATNSVFDLNNPRDLSVKFTKDEIGKMKQQEKMDAWNRLWRNYILSDNFEPGSTFKPFAVAAGLDEGEITDHSHFNCPGYRMINGERVKCVAFSRGGHGDISVTEVLMESCNAAMMDIGHMLGTNTFAKYTRAFGFGSKTGIDIPGEGNGIIFPAEMKPMDLAVSSFGQGQTVTMIQLASAMCSLINGGHYYQPHLVKQIQNENGATVKNLDGLIVRETVSKKTSASLRQMMFETVENGTASKAKVEGYQIGGKTGTAEKLPRDKTNYVVSFIGFTPVEKPEVLIYVVIDRPHVEDQAHSSYATELSSKIMKDILPFLGVYPTESSKIDKETKDETQKEGEETEETTEEIPEE